MLAGFVHADEDEYLRSLEAEAEKIGSMEPVETGSAETEDATAIDAQRNVFESYLKSKHRGTYAFYRKLPDRSKEEIFKAFVDGASMKDIRHMVIDRKLNR